MTTIREWTDEELDQFCIKLQLKPGNYYILVVDKCNISHNAITKLATHIREKWGIEAVLIVTPADVQNAIRIIEVQK